MSDELIKPVDPIECPFCRSKYAPRLYGWHERTEDGRNYNHRYAVRCLNCGAQGPKKEIGPHAVEAWNKRQQAPPQGTGELPQPEPDCLSPGDVAALRMIQRHLKGKYVSGLDILVAKNLLDELLQRRPADSAGGG